jgi:8-oxo-dGTP pyrophosphatase MutT (NUDIX family)
MIEPWKVMSSRVELEDRWIKVRSDSCRRSDGVVIEPYYVLEYPDWVCVLPITSQGDVVLTKEYRHGAGLVVTGLPSGVVDKTDITPMNTAKRELLEETGYTSQHVIALGSLYANWTNQDNMIHYFLALDAKLTGRPKLDASEEIDVVLAPWNDVRATPLLSLSHHIACVHLAEKHFSGAPQRP